MHAIALAPAHAFNQRGQRIAQNVGELHGDTIEQARLGNAMGKQVSLTEKGGLVNGVGDTPNQHDMLTGSQPDGRAYTDAADHTCGNWTSGGTGTAQLRGFGQAGRWKRIVEFGARQPWVQPGKSRRYLAAPGCCTVSP